jgi:hypothetical protein
MEGIIQDVASHLGQDVSDWRQTLIDTVSFVHTAC